MHLRPFSALLEELFALHGHQVTPEAPLEGMSGAVYTIPILAESDGHAVVVSGHLDGSPLTAAAVSEFAQTVSDVGADAGILVHTGPCDAGAVAAADGKVLLWDRPRVIRLLGEAQVARSLEETPAPLPLHASAEAQPTDLVAVTLDELLPPAFQEPEPAVDLSAMANMFTPEPAPTESTVLGSFEDLEAPRKRPAPPQPEEDDLQPFPPIPQQYMPEMPAPPPLDAFESHLLPPDHPLAMPLQPVMVSVAETRPPRPVAVAPNPWAAAAARQTAPIPAPAAPVAPPAFVPAPPAPAAGPFGALAASAQSFAPPMAGYPPTQPAPMPPMAAPAPRPEAAPSPVAPSGLPAFPNASKPVLPVRVRLEDAKRRVKDKLFSVRAVEILLQPVHIFEYECDVLKEGSLSFDTADGRVQVHGSDKGTLDVDPDQTNPHAPSLLAGSHPYAVEERVLRVAEDRARLLAFQHVVKKHTRSVSIRIPDHNNSLFYTEKRKVEPTSEQVRLRHAGVFLRPVWRLHGSNGIVDVDATDGREVMAEVRGGRTDAILIE